MKKAMDFLLLSGEHTPKGVVKKAIISWICCLCSDIKKAMDFLLLSGEHTPGGVVKKAIISKISTPGSDTT